MIYVVSWQSGAHAEPSVPGGVFSSLEIAKAQAQRRHRKTPLKWRELTTDDNQCKVMHEADLPDWYTKGCKITIWEMQLDRKHFR